jgi:hypothetical protein
MFLLCIYSTNIKAQHKERRIELLNLNINDQNLSTILDSIVLFEKKCSYYDSKLLFSFSVRKSDDNFFIIVESQKNINILLPLGKYGYFYHKNHLFFVGGDNCEDLFSTCGEKRIFKYLEYDSNYQPKDGKKIIYFFNDDSFSQWQYWYINKELLLEGKSTFCE